MSSGVIPTEMVPSVQDWRESPSTTGRKHVLIPFSLASVSLGGDSSQAYFCPLDSDFSDDLYHPLWPLLKPASCGIYFPVSSCTPGAWLRTLNGGDAWLLSKSMNE